jgi:hypothetical protein
LLASLSLAALILAWLVGSLLREPTPIARGSDSKAMSVLPRASGDVAHSLSSVDPTAEPSGDRKPDHAPGSAPSLEHDPSDSNVAGCLKRGDAESVRECLRSRLAATPEPASIAQILCTDDETADQHLILVTEALARLPASDALHWIDAMQRRCRRYQESDFLSACLLARKEQDPSWFSEVRATMTPQRLFSPDGDEAGIQIAVLFARQGDSEVREWIQAGARGDWGGTLKQIDRAMGLSISLQAPGTEWLSNLQSIIHSTSIPEGGAIGSTFVHALLDPRAWPDGTSAPALDTLVTVLYDPRFQDSAAATVCLSFPSAAPQGCDPTMWSLIRARASEVAGQIGLSIPSQAR